jgi:hypothetical protein
MRRTKWLFAPALLLACAAAAQAQAPKTAEHRTPSQSLEPLFRVVEKNLVGVADAMPADKYQFAPTEGEFKGVRTFGQQLKHAAATNYILAAAALGEKPPPDAGDETGPESLRTKAEIVDYLKGSFAYLHKALEAIDERGEVVASSPISPLQGHAATRLGLTVEALIHAYDHYGQTVEYLRMNGIVPPASR